MSTDDKRAPLSADELAYARFAVNRLRDPEQDDWPLMSRILDRLLDEHDALKAELAHERRAFLAQNEALGRAENERNAALRDLAEARAELAPVKEQARRVVTSGYRTYSAATNALADLVLDRAKGAAEARAPWEERPAQQQPAPSERSAPAAIEPDADAPLDVADLPAFWDRRRERQGKPDASRCAAELRRAIEHEGIGALTAVARELAPRVTEHDTYRAKVAALVSVIDEYDSMNGPTGWRDVMRVRRALAEHPADEESE